MNNFKKYKFSDCLSNIVDNRGKTCPTAKTGIPLIATNCIKNDSLYPVFENLRYITDETYDTWFRGHPESGDMIFVTKGSPGRICWVPSPVNFCIAQDMLAIRANEDVVDSKFLFALLRSKVVQHEIENLHVGSLIPHFKKGDFGQLYLDIPTDKNLQRKIGALYFSFCKKIELNRRMNQTLEQITQALFNHYFFDNIDPDNLPEGWKKGKLGEALSFRNGKSSSARDDDFSFPVFGSNGVIGYCDETNCKENSFIIGRVGSFCGSVYFTLEKAYVTDNAIIAESKIKRSWTFCYQLLRLLNLNNFKGGSGQPLVNQSVLSNIDIILPSINKIEEYEMAAFDFYKKIYHNEKENKTLAIIRDTLLPKLMSGEIDVDALMKEETLLQEGANENFKTA